MSRYAALAGLVGPAHNGGVLAGLSTYRLAEEDAARRAWLDEKTSTPVRALRQDCPECGSGGRHKPGCKQAKVGPPPRVSEARVCLPSGGKCRGPGCERKARACGLCGTHESQHRRGQPLTPIRPYVRRGPR